MSMADRCETSKTMINTAAIFCAVLRQNLESRMVENKEQKISSVLCCFVGYGNGSDEAKNIHPGLIR